MDKVINISKNDFYKLIKESIEKAINEIGDTPQGQFAINAVKGRAAARPKYQNGKFGGVPMKAKQDAIVNQAGDVAYNARKSSDPNYQNRDMDAYANAGYNYGYNKGMTSEENLNESIKKALHSVLLKEGFFDSYQLPEKKDDNDETSDTKKKDDSSSPISNKRKRVISRLKSDGVDVAQYAYRLWPNKDEDSARSYFYKCLNGEKNEEGVVYNFDDDEINRLHSLLSGTKL